MTGDFYHDNNAVLQIFSNMARQDSVFRSEAKKMLNETFLKIFKLMQTRSKSSSAANNNSEYVDMMATFDTRKKDHRIRAAGEPERCRKRKSNEVDGVQMDNEMIVD